MTAVKLKDIKGVMVGSPTDIDFTPSYKMGHRRAITQQGEVEIGLNRDNLTTIIIEFAFKMRHEELRFRDIADAIIAALPELIEVKNV